ncbi:hypothetical protein PCE1_001563 [Barthelona sp. PCE]
MTSAFTVQPCIGGKDAMHSFMPFPTPIAKVALARSYKDVKMRLLSIREESHSSSWNVGLGVTYQGVTADFKLGHSKQDQLKLTDDDSFEIGEVSLSSDESYIALYGLWCSRCGAMVTMNTSELGDVKSFIEDTVDPVDLMLQVIKDHKRH